MGELINLQQNTTLGFNLETEQLTMSSQEISEILQSRHDSVKRAMSRLKEKGLIQLIEKTEVNHKGQHIVNYFVSKRDSYTVMLQISPESREVFISRWLELEKVSSKERDEHITSIILHQEKMISLQGHQIEQLLKSQKELEDSFKELEGSLKLLDKKPIGSSGITFIRARMHKLHKLPARVVNEVLYSSPYAPKPAGQVRNNHEQAGNATYTVWYTSDVSKLFTRFVEECEFVTKTQAVHPDIDGRFKLAV